MKLITLLSFLSLVLGLPSPEPVWQQQQQQQQEPLLAASSSGSSLFESTFFPKNRAQFNLLETPPTFGLADRKLANDAGTIIFCSSPQDSFIPKYVGITPDPPQRGQPLLITINGTLRTAITEVALAQVMVKLGFIKLIDREYAVCDYVKEVDKTCPLEKGPLTISKALDIPNELPPGRYRVHVESFMGKTGEGEDEHRGPPITCLDVDFRL